MTTMEKNSSIEKESRCPGLSFVDDSGRITVFHPSAPEPVVPYWSPSLHGARRSSGAYERLRESVQKDTPAQDLFEGYLMSNLPLGEDIRLKSDRGFWLGDGLCLEKSLLAESITGPNVVFNVSIAESEGVVEGAFIPAGEIIVRSTGFLRQEGFFGETSVPYEKMREAKDDQDAVKALWKRHVRTKMEVFGYSPASCLLWIMDAAKMDTGEVVYAIGDASGAKVNIESGTVSVMTFEYQDGGIGYSDLLDEDNRDGSIFGSSEEGFVATSTAIGDGVYDIHPVYNVNNETIGYVIDFCHAFTKAKKKK